MGKLWMIYIYISFEDSNLNEQGIVANIIATGDDPVWYVKVLVALDKVVALLAHVYGFDIVLRLRQIGALIPNDDLGLEAAGPGQKWIVLPGKNVQTGDHISTLPRSLAV